MSQWNIYPVLYWVYLLGIGSENREEGIEATMVKLAELEGNVGIKGMVRAREGGKGRVDVFETSWFVA